jgi:hypothetical protein
MSLDFVLGRHGALAAQSFNEFHVAISHRRVERRKAIVTNPVQIGAALEQTLGRR